MVTILLLVGSMKGLTIVALQTAAYKKLSTTKWRYNLSQICTHHPHQKEVEKKTLQCHSYY